MNERIKQIAERAGMTDDKFGMFFAEDYNSHCADGVDLEKFAKLIVKECVDICNQAILQNQDTLSKLNTDELAEKMVIHGSINQAQKLGKGIKEHFGVAE
jgi:hypothetical protein